MTAITFRKRVGRPDEASLKRFAATLSVLTAAFLIALKTGAGYLTGSISVWASLLDSVMDIVASVINFFAVRAASRPPDRDHAYGHGKAESLAGLFQSMVIALSGLFLIREGIGRLLAPPALRSELIGAASMFIAMAVSLILVSYLSRIATVTDSPALHSDAAHYRTDIFTNGGALIALLITLVWSWRPADPLISIAISVYILWSAVRIARESIDTLMDRRLPFDIDDQVAGIIDRYSQQGVRGFHDLRTRRSGSHKFIDLHIEIERTKPLEEAHAVVERVIRDIESEIPRSHVQIHTEPSAG